MSDTGFLRWPSAPLARVLDYALHTRALARAPIQLYRRGFGFLFGQRMIMLEHTGRRTGTARYVVLEVVDRPDPDVYVVPSGFGERSQWYRNVMANPEVKVSSGRRRDVRAIARRLPSDEGDKALQHYIARHPRSWENLKRVVERSLGARVDPPGSRLPMVEVRIA